MSKIIPLMIKIGDRVRVVRQIGKDGPKEPVTGEVIGLPKVIRIHGEKTATIRYDDGLCSPYPHKFSSIEILTDE